jgi:hypothetical protein
MMVNTYGGRFVIRRNSNVDPHPAAGEAASLPRAREPGRDAQRATVLTAADGGYRFQSDPPTHIHLLVSAEGSSRWPATATTPRDGPPAASTSRWHWPDPDGWRLVAALG